MYLGITGTQAYKGVLSCCIGIIERKNCDTNVLKSLEFAESCQFCESLEANIPKTKVSSL